MPRAAPVIVVPPVNELSTGRGYPDRFGKQLRQRKSRIAQGAFTSAISRAMCGQTRAAQDFDLWRGGAQRPDRSPVAARSVVLGLGMTHNPEDLGKFGAHTALHSLDGGMGCLDRNGWIDPAMVVDHKAARRFAHAHLMNVADPADILGAALKRDRDCANARRIGVNAGEHMRR